MTSDDDFEPVPDEQEPESLRRKWDAEEIEDMVCVKQMKTCPHCGKPIEAKSFSCLYCGTRVFSDSGPIGKLGHWISEGKFVLVILGLVAAFLILTVMF